ncbi:MAG: cobalamin-dependent protein [Nannocystaceae bacterium]
MTKRAIVARAASMDMDKATTKTEPNGDPQGPEGESNPDGKVRRGHAGRARPDTSANPIRSSSVDPLVDAVTNHIIPRLLLAHRMEAPKPVSSKGTRGPPTTAEVAQLVEAAAAQDYQGGIDQVDARLREGLAIESVLLDWISAAARLLGEQWMSDDRTFAEVTLGMGTLHRILAALRHRLSPPLSHRGLVVLTAAPGEQHTLAIHVLGDLLKLAGWETVVEPSPAEEELIAMVSCESVTMVGVSVSSLDLIGGVRRLATRLRKVSANPDLAIMLGGAVDLSEEAKDMGAIFCPSAQLALSWLENHAQRRFEQELAP